MVMIHIFPYYFYLFLAHIYFLKKQYLFLVIWNSHPIHMGYTIHYVISSDLLMSNGAGSDIQYIQ